MRAIKKRIPDKTHVTGAKQPGGHILWLVIHCYCVWLSLVCAPLIGKQQQPCASRAHKRWMALLSIGSAGQLIFFISYMITKALILQPCTVDLRIGHAEERMPHKSHPATHTHKHTMHFTLITCKIYNVEPFFSCNWSAFQSWTAPLWQMNCSRDHLTSVFGHCRMERWVIFVYSLYVLTHCPQACEGRWYCSREKKK